MRRQSKPRSATSSPAAAGPASLKRAIAIRAGVRAVPPRRVARRWCGLAAPAGVLLAVLLASACTPAPAPTRPGAPRLVLCVVVDQLRADYLERFRPLFQHGFKQLLEEGVVFTEAHHDHAVTTTSPGHATLATGLWPAHHGIVDNEWFDDEAGEVVYSVADDKDGTSPRRLLGATLGDWLKQADGRSRVFAVSGKDRGAVLSAGRLADGAFWYDRRTGGMKGSRYYRQPRPPWLAELNHRGLADPLLGRAWERLPAVVGQPADAALGVEVLDRGLFPRGFPHVYGGNGLTLSPDEDFYDSLADTPFLDEITAATAEALLAGADLGRDGSPDLLAVSFSAVDIVGHAYGPNSPEALDTVLRLDRLLGELLAAVDRQVGLANVIVSLSADHGVVPLPEYQALAGLPGRRLDTASQLCIQGVEGRLEAQLGASEGPWLRPGRRYGTAAAGRPELEATLRRELAGCPGVVRVWVRSELAGAPLADPVGRLYQHSFRAGRSGDFFIQFTEGYLPLAGSGTTHGSPYDYDSHVPWLLRLPAARPAVVDAPVHTVDVAPTLARLLGVKVPTGLDGEDRAGLLPPSP